MNAIYETVKFAKVETKHHNIALNANTLKMIAIFAMVLDHSASVFLPVKFEGIWYIRMIGRIVAPIMCFFIAEDYWHTSNLKRCRNRSSVIFLGS